MQTLTMQGIAELAQVKRPVVSVWRTRYSAASADAFPEPTSQNPLRFDAAQVSEWLASTGRGNNPEARFESPLHSGAFQCVVADPDHASALLLLHHLLGEPLDGLDPSSAAAHLDAHRVGSILDVETLRSALSDEPLCTAVDELAEAAFSGARALDRLVDTFVSVDGPWAGEALTVPARELLGSIIAELHRASPRTIVPAGSGALDLIGSLTRHLNEHERPTVASAPDLPASAADRAAWRRFAAHGFPVAYHGTRPGEVEGARGRLHLLVRQGVERPRTLVEQVKPLLLGLADDDVLVVIGPARLLTDLDGRRNRAGLLAPSKDYAAPLRYAARLPKGLSRFGGRRRLALWVFGRPESHWTVVADHADTLVNAAVGSAIAADVAASISEPGDIRAHAFRSSSVRETQHLVRRDELIAAPGPAVPVPTGGERLARVWALRDELATSPAGNPIDGVDLVAGDSPRPHAVSLAEATPRLALDLAGTRIPAEHLGAATPGCARVIGPEEVRDPALIGRHGIDRLTLEEVAPQARLTEPGDVVYVATGGPAATIDEDGGHVVLAPARVIRCRTDPSHRRQLLAPVVAADIAAHSGTDRRTWRLRTVPVEQASQLSALTERTGRRRQRLLRELRTLDDLERELVGGLTDGSLNAPLLPSPVSPSPKAAR